MNRRNKLLLEIIVVTLFCISLSACDRPQQQQSKNEPPSKDVDPIGAQLRERGEKLTQELARQKQIKASIAQMPVIEQFKRETDEREVLAKLGEPEATKDITMQKIQQRVFFYKKENYAIWLWREHDDKGPYLYRASVSLKNGKFDMPLHNVFEEAELLTFRQTLDVEPK